MNASPAVVNRAANWAAFYAGLRSTYETAAGLALLAYGLAGTAHIPCAVDHMSIAMHCKLENQPTYNSTMSLFWYWFAHLGNWWPFAWTQVIIPSLRAANTRGAVKKQIENGKEPTP